MTRPSNPLSSLTMCDFVLQGFDPVVTVLFGDVPRRRQQFLQHAEVGRRLVGRDLDWPRRLLQRPGENRRAAAASRLPVASTSMTCPNWSIARYR